jgi:hypothetical protein
MKKLCKREENVHTSLSTRIMMILYNLGAGRWLETFLIFGSKNKFLNPQVQCSYFLLRGDVFRHSLTEYNACNCFLSSRLLGNFAEAARDLRLACKIDFDDTADEWLKEVTPNVSSLKNNFL